MRVSALAIAAVIIPYANAFAPNAAVARTRSFAPLLRASVDPLTPTSAQNNNNNIDTAPFDKALKEYNLKAALNFVETHDDISLTPQRWSDIFAAIEERTANAEENTENLRAEFPIQSAARMEMTKMYDWLQQKGHLQIYRAVDARLPLAAGSHTVSPTLLESILDLPIKALTPKSNNAIAWAGATVALVEGLISVATGISINSLVLLTLASVFLDRLFLNGAVFETFIKLFSPGIQEKILRHEAGHFLCAYLLGCPVEGFVLSAWAATADRRFGTRQVSAGTSFYDPELSQQINSRGKVTRSTLDRYSIIVMAGIAAEAVQYGQADGGAGDEMALIAFLSQLNGTSGKGSWNPDKIRNQARWGALQAVLLIRHYKPAYEALMDAMERGGSLGDCIYAIEKAAREHKLTAVTEPLGYISKVGDGSDETVWSKEPVTGGQQQLDRIVTSANNSVGSNNSDGNIVAEPFDGEQSIRDLQDYRATVEARLREVEDKLSKIDNK